MRPPTSLLRPLLRRPSHLPQPRFNSTTSASPPISLTTTPAPHFGQITTLTLTSPSTRNALSTPLLQTVHSHLLHLPPQTRALILTSTLPRIFCAGADLRERRSFTSQQTLSFLKTLNSVLNTLDALPIPTIAAIDGFALGGGLELALAADIRVAGPSAVFALPELRLGVLPGGGGTWRLPRAVGYARAKEMVLTGRRVGPKEAMEMGLVTGLAEEGEVAALAESVARECCEGAPMAVRAVKRVFAMGEEMEREGYLEILESRDRREALVAFAEKRKVVWKGE